MQQCIYFFSASYNINMKNFFINNKNIIILCLLILLVAGIGGIFVRLGMEWFNTLLKPNEWIPNFVIPIMWTIIYILFAIFLSISIKNKSLSTNVVILSVINGVLNILWCLVFFALNQLLLGNIIIIINAFFGTLLVNEMIKNNKWYFYLSAIYPIWLYLATSLNTALWILN